MQPGGNTGLGVSRLLAESAFIAELPLESEFPFPLPIGRATSSGDENPSLAEIRHNFVSDDGKDGSCVHLSILE